MGTTLNLMLKSWEASCSAKFRLTRYQLTNLTNKRSLYRHQHIQAPEGWRLLWHRRWTAQVDGRWNVQGKHRGNCHKCRHNLTNNTCLFSFNSKPLAAAGCRLWTVNWNNFRYFQYEIFSDFIAKDFGLDYVSLIVRSLWDPVIAYPKITVSLCVRVVAEFTVQFWLSLT